MEDIRIQLHGISAKEFAEIFNHNEIPDIGYEYIASENFKLVNLTSDELNLVDSATFTLIAQFAGQIAVTVAINLLSNYIYDKIKRKDVKMTVNNNMVVIISPSDKSESAEEQFPKGDVSDEKV